MRFLRLYVSSSSPLGLYEEILKCDLGPLFLCTDEWSVTRTTNSITCTRKGNNTYNPNKYLEKPLTGNKVAANINITRETKALYCSVHSGNKVIKQKIGLLYRQFEEYSIEFIWGLSKRFLLLKTQQLCWQGHWHLHLTQIRHGSNPILMHCISLSVNITVNPFSLNIEWSWCHAPEAVRETFEFISQWKAALSMLSLKSANFAEARK